MTGDRLASPGLHQLTLGVLTTIDTWSSDPALDAFRQIVEAATDQADLIPGSIGVVLPLLAGERERLRVALDLVVRLDLYEAANGLDTLVWRGHPEAVLAAAALAPHPGVGAEFRELVGAHAADMTEPWERDLFLTRLNPEHRPERESARADRQVRWFDNVKPTESPYPLALEPAMKGLNAGDQLRLAADLSGSGVVVRRLPPENSVPILPGWLPAWAPTVGPIHRDRIRPPARLDSIARQRVVREVLAVFPRRQPLHQAARRVPSAGAIIDTIEAFDDGALPRPETAFLSGWRGRRLDAWKKYEALRPIEFHGIYHWRFSQVVAFRAAAYLHERAGKRRDLGKTAAHLVEIVRNERQVPVGITSDGRVMVNRDGDLEDVATGVRASEEIISMTDVVYEPFTLGGNEVPRLLRPSQYTAVDPAIVAGLPCLAGTRISANAARSALDTARRSGADDPFEMVRRMYPELNDQQIADAEHLTSLVRAAR